MSKIIVGIIDDIFAGETLEILFQLKKDGAISSIATDTVTLTIKEDKSDADAAAVLQANADVTTYGGDGIAYWNLTPVQMAITPGVYYIDVVWYDGTKEHVVYDGTVKIKTRVSDL